MKYIRYILITLLTIIVVFIASCSCKNKKLKVEMIENDYLPQYHGVYHIIKSKEDFKKSPGVTKYIVNSEKYTDEYFDTNSLIYFILNKGNSGVSYKVKSYSIENDTIKINIASSNSTNHALQVLTSVQVFLEVKKEELENVNNAKIIVNETDITNKFEEVKQENLAYEVKEEYLALAKKTRPDATFDDIVIMNYLGTYDKKFVCVIVDIKLVHLDIWCPLTIDGLDFGYSQGYPIRIYDELTKTFSILDSIDNPFDFDILQLINYFYHNEDKQPAYDDVTSVEAEYFVSHNTIFKHGEFKIINNKEELYKYFVTFIPDTFYFTDEQVKTTYYDKVTDTLSNYPHDILEKYTDEYFKENTIILFFLDEESGGNRKLITKWNIENRILNIDVRTARQGETDDMAYWMFLLEVPVIDTYIQSVKIIDDNIDVTNNLKTSLKKTDYMAHLYFKYFGMLDDPLDSQDDILNQFHCYTVNNALFIDGNYQGQIIDISNSMSDGFKDMWYEKDEYICCNGITKEELAKIKTATKISYVSSKKDFTQFRYTAIYIVEVENVKYLLCVPSSGILSSQFIKPMVTAVYKLELKMF